jgi:hypothetical protein
MYENKGEVGCSVENKLRKDGQEIDNELDVAIRAYKLGFNDGVKLARMEMEENE